MQHRILYFSPAGTTAQIATWIDQCLREHAQESVLIDLAAVVKHEDTSLQALDWSEPCCLWLGSPVYCDHAVPLVEQVLAQLPESVSGFSVPFVTWGGVTSGLALPELAVGLEDKGLKTLAAGKFLAQHSSTWKVDEPFYHGYPGKGELSLVQQLVNLVCVRLATGSGETLNPERLNYLPEAMKADSELKSLALVKAALPPLEADKTLCTGCGICVQQCPLQCINLDPYPVLGSECIRCMQCVRHCPEEAFSFSPEPVYARIIAMAQDSAEEKVSQIYS